ncbi:hypothetical protein [Bradyrhizobium sp. P5_C11_2]
MRIRILPIEAHQQRYTCEWVSELPKRLRRAAKRKGVATQIRSIKGTLLRQGTTPETFLNFAATNIYKGTQIARVAELFNNGEVQPGDIFVVPDAWHPGVHQIRYMSELLEVPVVIFGLWHAGSYDPNDFLARIARRQWARGMEQALFDAYDLNVFATRYHVELFCDAFDLSPAHPRIAQCGWPMEYLPNVLAPYAGLPKENIVLFPHRLAPEKQVDMFRDLAGSFPDWRFIVCQETSRSKEEYHRLLAQSRVVFSCSLQETLGIGCYEGVLAGAVPVVPDRLSYRELYPAGFRYPSEWTLNEDAYRRNKPALVAHLREVLTRAEQGGFELEGCRQQLTPFFSGDELYAKVLEGL